MLTLQELKDTFNLVQAMPCEEVQKHAIDNAFVSKVGQIGRTLCVRCHHMFRFHCRQEDVTGKNDFSCHQVDCTCKEMAVTNLDMVEQEAIIKG